MSRIVSGAGRAVFAVGALLLSVGCGTDADSANDAATVASSLAASTNQNDTDQLPDRIICITQYRPDAESMAGAEEPTLTVERDDAEVADGESIEFATMKLSVSYSGEAPEGRTVNIVVTASTGELITTALFQIGTPALDDIHFAGDHGFTGLHYVYHEGAMLQFTCRAE
jgi:hypothetical protein